MRIVIEVKMPRLKALKKTVLKGFSIVKAGWDFVDCFLLYRGIDVLSPKRTVTMRRILRQTRRRFV